jgi:hypothetical protein
VSGLGRPGTLGIPWKGRSPSGHDVGVDQSKVGGESGNCGCPFWGQRWGRSEGGCCDQEGFYDGLGMALGPEGGYETIERGSVIFQGVSKGMKVWRGQEGVR